MFDPAYPLSQLNPAPYNPRIIDDASLTRLQESLQTLGLIKPVIVTNGQTLVAGHQRTKAMQALGYTHCPAFVLDNVNTSDEIRFNQLHNASDLEISADVQLRIPPQFTTGFIDVPASEIEGSLLCKNASKKREVLQLLTRYGAWGGIVATQSGEVLVSHLYAIASKTLGMSCKTYVVRDEQKDQVLTFFGQSYGRFSYAHLPRTTWGQSLAQMFRLRQPSAHSTCGELHSRTYETLVLPYVTKETRILDFGAGQMDYVKRLRGQGYAIQGIEFYLRKGSQLNVTQAQKDITALCEDLAEHGRYDFVVCDSVINSVDSLQAEADILTCLNALCKPGGTVVFSGRNRNSQIYQEYETTHSRDQKPRTNVNFFDENYMSALYWQGVWLYQKYHTRAEVDALLQRYFASQGSIFVFQQKSGQRGASQARRLLTQEFPNSGTSWGAMVRKRRELPENEVREALSREFDLPLPQGRSFGRSHDILQAWEQARNLEVAEV